ncbi:hypothetical protein GGU45_001854 [Niabella hirudinis]
MSAYNYKFEQYGVNVELIAHQTQCYNCCGNFYLSQKKWHNFAFFRSLFKI